ncbi:MAG: hypothetical protein EAX95_04875 [Candidatus Thorarchaeota archaeon]|nr:hypothetical protein [Candidatus Thorarchaeota archaeon]
MRVGRNWPRRSLDRMIAKISEGPTTTKVPLGRGIQDITLDPGLDEQFIEYAPIIKLIGQERVTETRSRMWGGVLVRALQKEGGDSSSRCLQYIYTYTVQRGGVSLFYNVIVPILLAILALVSPLLFGSWGYPSISPPISPFELAILTEVVASPLFAVALGAHLSDFVDKDKKQFHIRGTTWLLLFGSLPPALVLYLHADLSGSLLTIVTLFWWAYWGLLVVFFAGWCLSIFGIGPACHKMDYAPVFVYLKKTEWNKWEFDSACWDYYHYQAVCKTEETEGLLRKGTRARLVMTDPWHALSRGSRINTRGATGVGVLFLLVALILPVVTAPENWFQPWTTMFTLLFFVVGGVIVAQMPLGGGALSNLRVLRDGAYLREKAYLSNEKILTLWNLSDKDAQLIIRTKLQDPFENYPGNTGTFKDTS